MTHSVQEVSAPRPFTGTLHSDHLRCRQYVGRPWRAPGGFAAIPTPRLIRPTVRRLLRSPRFRVRVPIFACKARLSVFVAPGLNRWGGWRQGRNNLSELAKYTAVMLAEIPGEAFVQQESLDVAARHDQPEVIWPQGPL